jgi:hypothetical protein
MFDIFGDYGVWKSPGGKAKEFENNRVKVTWYENESLIFKGDIGERINQLMIKEREVNPIARDTLQNDKLQAMTKEQDIYNTNNEPQNPNELCASQMSNSLNNPASIDSMMFSDHNKNKSGDLNSDCSTLQELEDFIEQTFQNAFNSNVNDSIACTNYRLFYPSAAPKR